MIVEFGGKYKFTNKTYANTVWWKENNQYQNANQIRTLRRMCIFVLKMMIRVKIIGHELKRLNKFQSAANRNVIYLLFRIREKKRLFSQFNVHTCSFGSWNGSFSIFKAPSYTLLHLSVNYVTYRTLISLNGSWCNKSMFSRIYVCYTTE